MFPSSSSCTQKRPQECPMCLKRPRNDNKMLQKWSENDPKRSPKMTKKRVPKVPKMTKMVSKWPQRNIFWVGTEWPEDESKGTKNGHEMFQKKFRTTHQNGTKMTQNDTKMVSKNPKWQQNDPPPQKKQPQINQKRSQYHTKRPQNCSKMITSWQIGHKIKPKWPKIIPKKHEIGFETS